MTLRKGKILILPVRNRIIKAWDTVFELMQIEAQCNKNHFTFFCYVKLELRKGTLTWNKKCSCPKLTKNDKSFLSVIWSVSYKKQTSQTTSGYELLRVTTSDCKWLRVTASDHKWLQVPTSDYEPDSKWLRVTKSDYKWLQMTISGCRSSFGSI